MLKENRRPCSPSSSASSLHTCRLQSASKLQEALQAAAEGSLPNWLVASMKRTARTLAAPPAVASAEATPLATAADFQSREHRAPLASNVDVTLMATHDMPFRSAHPLFPGSAPGFNSSSSGKDSPTFATSARSSCSVPPAQAASASRPLAQQTPLARPAGGKVPVERQ